MKVSTDLFAEYSRWFTVIALIVVIAAGISFRLEDLGHWRNNEQQAFLDGQPLHTTFDAWFYLSLAQDLVDGSYDPVNERRGVPDSPARPSPPPLISVVAAAIARTGAVSMSWIGALLPAILGPLLAIPMYLLGRFYGGRVMGITTALVSVLYPFFIYRTNIGRFDTDCMNVAWAAATVYLFVRFGIETSKRRYLYFLGGVLVYAVFLWWWDQAPGAVTLITAAPLAVALIFFYRPEKKQGLVFYSTLVIACVVLLLMKGPDAPIRIISNLWSKYLYITKDASGDFPNIGVTISEQSKPSLDLLISYTTIHVLPFIFALAGIVLLFWKRFKDALFLMPLVALSIGAFFANRFLIFLIPVIAIGTGYSMSTLWSLRRRFRAVYIVCPLLLALFVWPLYTANKAYLQWPVEPGPTAAGMYAARKNTPPDAVIWAWWDHGYALTYLARRATVDDGSIHGGERTVYAALPLTTDSYRLAANFMNFYVIRGIAGINRFYEAAGDGPAAGLKLIQRILRAGPAEARVIIEQADLKPIENRQDTDGWLEFFYPAERRPVYLFLDNLLTRTAYWWYWFGSWDVGKQDGHHPSFKPFFDISDEQHSLVSADGLKLDKQTGRLTIGDRAFELSSLGIRKKDGFENEKYDHYSSYRFDYLEQARFGAFMDFMIAESVFNKLYIRHLYPVEYFRPVGLNTPHFQLWEVTGDSLSD